jgi:hypothetical protein
VRVQDLEHHGPARRHEGVLGLWELVGIIYFATSGGPEGTEGLVSSGGALGTLAGIIPFCYATKRDLKMLAKSFSLTVMMMLAGIVLMAIFWSVPIALMAAEMGTSVPVRKDQALVQGILPRIVMLHSTCFQHTREAGCQQKCLDDKTKCCCMQENGGPMVWSRAAWGAGSAFGDALAFLAGWMSFLFSAVDAALYPSMFLSYLSNGIGTEIPENWQLVIKLCFALVLVAHNCLGVRIARILMTSAFG